MIRKILILNPNMYSRRRTVTKSRLRQPLDLAYIASILRDNFEIKLIDAMAQHMDVKEMLKAVTDFEPDILITTTTPIDRWECPQSYIDSLFDLLDKINRLKNKPVIVVAGTHGTTQPDWLLNKSRAVDFVIRGEPERTTEKLINVLANEGDFSSVRGISYREANEIKHTLPAERILDLNSLPFPAYDLLPMEKYSYSFSDIPRPFSIVLATRGCPYRCTYCCRVMMENAYIIRDPANVYGELELLCSSYGVRGVFFQDWEFLIDKKFVNELLDLLLNKPLPLKWGCNVRANDFRTPEIFKKMKTAGCVRVNIGFESGSDRVLKSINKLITTKDLVNAIEITKNLDMNLGMYTLLNAPGETPKTIRETMKFIHDQNIKPMNFNLVVPYFGTEVNKELVAQLGRSASKINWDNIENYAGKVRTTLSPSLARLYKRHVSLQLDFNRWYIVNLKFYKWLAMRCYRFFRH